MKPETLVLASSNSGKLAELRQILGKLPYKLRPQSEFGVSDTPETGRSFVENALIKARRAAMVAGHAALADDSGLVVPALGGSPGLRSARYDEAGGDGNLAKLLAAISHLPEERPAAFFYCAAVYLRDADDPMPLFSCAAWEGKLLSSPRGTNGFGYDPIFFLPERDCSAAEMTFAEKVLCSHRAQAFRYLARLMATTF